jgi:hypothetical protein
MNLPKTVTMTRTGGRYWRAMAFRLALTWPVLPFVLILLLVAIINPFWFRDSMFNWIERQINAFSRWRDYHQYAIYLGADPRMWHTLKDSK